MLRRVDIEKKRGWGGGAFLRIDLPAGGGGRTEFEMEELDATGASMGEFTTRCDELGGGVVPTAVRLFSSRFETRHATSATAAFSGDTLSQHTHCISAYRQSGQLQTSSVTCCTPMPSHLLSHLGGTQHTVHTDSILHSKPSLAYKSWPVSSPYSPYLIIYPHHLLSSLHNQLLPTSHYLQCLPPPLLSIHATP